MEGQLRSVIRVAVVGLVTMLLANVTLGCGAAEPTSTPIPPVAPAPAVAPTAAPQAIASVATGVPTSVPSIPTPAPTRVLPTATQAPAVKAQYGGTLRYPLTQSFDTLDPAFSGQIGFRPVHHVIYNGLVKLESDGTIGPDLASSWTISDNGTTLTFKLRTGVRFQDGTAVDAQSVKWNLDRMVKPDVGSVWRGQLIPPMEKVEANGDQVTIHLSIPFRPFLSILTDRAGKVTSPTAVQKLNSYAEPNGDFGRKPVGSGPFKLREWVPGSHIAVDKNEQYWDKALPYLDGIRFIFIADTQVQLAMLRTGEIDLMIQIPPTNVSLAETNPRVKVIRQEGSRFRMFWFNVNKAPWDKKALRAAFAYAMDRETLVRTQWNGEAMPAYQPVGPIYGKWYDPTIRVYEFNPQLSRQKLAEAGYPSGFSYDQPCSNSSFEIQWCEALQQLLANVGIRVQLQLWQASTYFSDWSVGKFSAPAITGFTPNPDPNITPQRLFHSKGSRNIPKFSDALVDSLLDEAASLYDVAAAKEVYRKAFTRIAEEAPVVFIVYETELYGIGNHVQNFMTFADREVRLSDIWLKR